jgi:flagellar assembly protein FliH
MSPAELESLVAERAIHRAAEQTLEAGRDAMLEALQRIEDAHSRMVNELTARAAELATLVARRVIARELRTEREIVVDLVREALDVLNSRDRVRVHLGPEFAVMQNALVAHYAAMGTLIDVIVDDTLPAYGCVVETDVGSVDESIDSRLAALLDAVSGNEGD